MFNEKIGVTEELEVNGISVTDDLGGINAIGEVTQQLVNKRTGNVIFEFKPMRNKIVLGGSTHILESIFKTRSGLNIDSISKTLGINASVLPTSENLLDEKIFGFTIGITGSDPWTNIIKQAEYTDRTVDTMIPFRITVEPLPAEDAAKYGLVKFVDGVYKYYVKKFTAPPVIRSVFIDGSEVPDNVTSDFREIRTYSECICDIDPSDLREYFLATNGNIDNCYFNSLGLVKGFFHGSDYANVKLFSKLNIKSNSDDFNNNENILRYIYRIYSK